MTVETWAGRLRGRACAVVAVGVDDVADERDEEVLLEPQPAAPNASASMTTSGITSFIEYVFITIIDS